jgi:4'-phosphopantetheinyl transferase EntD
MNPNSARPHCLSRSVRRGVPPSSAATLAGRYGARSFLRLFRDQAGRPSPRGSAVPPASAGLIAKEAV